MCGKVLDAVSLGFSFSGKGKREVLNKIDSFQIFSSISRMPFLKIAQVDVLFGCSCSMSRISFLKDFNLIKCWLHHFVLFGGVRLIVSVICLFKLPYRMFYGAICFVFLFWGFQNKVTNYCWPRVS